MKSQNSNFKKRSFGLQTIEEKMSHLLKPIFQGSKKEFILINNLVKKTIKNTHKSNNINNVYITKKCEQSKLTRILCKGSNFLFKHREIIEILEKGEQILSLTEIPYLAKIYKMVIGFVKTSNKIFRLYMADMNYLDSANLNDPPTLRNVIIILNSTGILTESNAKIILQDIHKVHEKETLIYLIKNILHTITKPEDNNEKDDKYEKNNNN